MPKLTASQVAGMVGVSSYTIKRWYNWYENLSKEELKQLADNGMPILPNYETVGSTKWRYWEDADIQKIIEFKNWVPHTKNGIFNKKGE
jgi:hypothetical protein